MNKFLEGLKKIGGSVLSVITDYLHVVLFLVGLIILLSVIAVISYLVSISIFGILLMLLGYYLKNDTGGGK